MHVYSRKHEALELRRTINELQFDVNERIYGIISIVGICVGIQASRIELCHTYFSFFL